MKNGPLDGIRAKQRHLVKSSGLKSSRLIFGEINHMRNDNLVVILSRITGLYIAANQHIRMIF